MSTHPQNPVVQPLTEAQLDRALGTPDDAILPSSGFADGVMAAVAAAAPAPIPFPWKRAWPLLAAAPVALAILVAACVAGLRGLASHPALPAGARFDFAAKLNLAGLLHPSADTTVFWIGVSLAIPLLCVGLMWRTVFNR